MPSHVLVAWCAACLHYLPADEAGTVCPSDDCQRMLRKRRAWICADEHGIEGPQAFLSRADYDHHRDHHHEG